MEDQIVRGQRRPAPSSLNVMSSSRWQKVLRICHQRIAVLFNPGQPPRVVTPSECFLVFNVLLLHVAMQSALSVSASMTALSSATTDYYSIIFLHDYQTVHNETIGPIADL